MLTTRPSCDRSARYYDGPVGQFRNIGLSSRCGHCSATAEGAQPTIVASSLCLLVRVIPLLLPSPATGMQTQHAVKLASRAPS